MYYGDIFQSGAVASTYAPFNNPEIDDPWPLIGRGSCFSTGKYITSKIDIRLNYQHTIAMWTR